MGKLRATGLVLLLASTLAGCGGGGDQGAHTVLTDSELTTFPASYFGYFPRVVRVHAGDTVVFKQAWTGEPHTVTLGNAIEPLATAVGDLIKGTGTFGPDSRRTLDAAASSVPSIFDADRKVNQTLATSCLVSSGALPSGGGVCRDRKLTAFTGRETLFNSGFIPYQGNSGNRFRMKLADSIKTGDYFFYCALHGPTMGGFLRVVAKSASVDDNAALARRARAEISAATARLQTAHDRLRDNAADSADVIAGGFTALSPDGLVLPFGTVNDFEPRTFRAAVGQTVSWLVPRGPGHTISFGAPANLPSVRIDADGYQLNPKAYDPQGGPGYPRGHPNTSTAVVDAGRYDGTGFLSSGFPYGPMRYSITFTKAGTYRYVCLLHPRMVGSVVVS